MSLSAAWGQQPRRDTMQAHAEALLEIANMAQVIEENTPYGTRKCHAQNKIAGRIMHFEG